MVINKLLSRPDFPRPRAAIFLLPCCCLWIDTPLLVSFVQATLIARSTAHDPDKAQLWEWSVKLQATLATRLRLAPQARTARDKCSRVAGGDQFHKERALALIEVCGRLQWRW
jgi:hypothetical protein